MSAKDDQRLLSALGADHPEASRVLNVPAGDGTFSRLLRERGHTVTSADLFPEGCTEDPSCVEADMNAPLPFEDGAFDVVVSQEGVEHLENLAGFLRESRRILRPGGTIWITTPNFMDLSSRLAFLLSGQKSYKAGLPNENSTLWGRDGDRLYHGHAFTLPYFQLRYLLRVVGFEDVSVGARGWSRSSCVLYPFFLPLNALVLRYGMASRARKDAKHGRTPPDDALMDELRTQGLSRALLCGKGITVRARVPDQPTNR